MQKAQRRIPGFHKLEPGQETSFRLGSSSQPVQQVRGKRHRPCRSGPSRRRSLAGLGLARPAGSSFLVIVSCGNPCVGCCRCILPSRPWFRIRPRCQATSKHPEPAAALSSKLRRCQAKPRFELSNMGLLSTVAIARAGVLCGLPRSQTGHRSHGESDRSCDGCRHVGWLVVLCPCSRPLDVPPNSVSSGVLVCSSSNRRAGGLQVTSTALAVSLNCGWRCLGSRLYF